MVCCEEDTSLIGMVCEHPAAKQLIPNEWVEVTGTIDVQYDPDINGNFCLLKVDFAQSCLNLLYLFSYSNFQLQV